MDWYSIVRTDQGFNVHIPCPDEPDSSALSIEHAGSDRIRFCARGEERTIFLPGHADPEQSRVKWKKKRRELVYEAVRAGAPEEAAPPAGRFEFKPAPRAASQATTETASSDSESRDSGSDAEEPAGASPAGPAGGAPGASNVDALLAKFEEHLKQVAVWKLDANKAFASKEGDKQANLKLARETYDKMVAYMDDTADFCRGFHDLRLANKREELDAQRLLCLCNRAQVFLTLQEWQRAFDDANAVMLEKPCNVKARYRRGWARMELGELELALEDFDAVLVAVQNSPDAKAKRAHCLEMLGRSPDEPTSPRKCELRDWSGDVDPAFIQQLVADQREQKTITKPVAIQLIRRVKRILQDLPTLVHITVPDDVTLTVCGDVHGQYYDLLHIFESNGFPSEKRPYLFNGDFVDRGVFSVETILLLFALKCQFPEHVHLARGNHETPTMNKLYGFEGEVTEKFDNDVFNEFTLCFQHLPLAHVINKKVFVVHGGLPSRDDVTLKEIDEIDRVNQDDSVCGLMCELLWADPQPEPGRSPSRRGVGVQFGPDVTEKFLKLNGLEYMIRSHEMKMEGYEVMHGGKCITIFSAPNYCDQMRNRGAFIHLSGADMKPVFQTFPHSWHPNVRKMYMRCGFGFPFRPGFI